MRLTDWQLAFERHLLADADDTGFAGTLIGGPTLDVDTGLAIYHNAYRARLLEVMQGDFPAVQQVLCRFNSLQIWRAVKAQAGFPGSQALPLAEVCLIWRHQQVCRYRSLEPAEAYALAGMADSGWSFSELCAELAVTYQEGAPLQAVTWLKQWVEDGLLQRRAP